MQRMRQDANGWCRCGKCGHKLFRYSGEMNNLQGVEIKCHSCREINNYEAETNYIFTFGVGQKYDGRYIKIRGTYESAREEMVRRYGDKWAFQYSEQEWNDWVAKCHREGLDWLPETELEETEMAQGVCI